MDLTLEGETGPLRLMNIKRTEFLIFLDFYENPKDFYKYIYLQDTRITDLFQF